MAWATAGTEGTRRGGALPESRTAADYVRNLTTLARQGFNVVFAVGFLMEDALAKVAPRFPKTYFGIVDGKRLTCRIACR